MTSHMAKEEMVLFPLIVRLAGDGGYASPLPIEADTHAHIHLENNVLFPRAEELAAAAPQPAASI